MRLAKYFSSGIKTRGTILFNAQNDIVSPKYRELKFLPVTVNNEAISEK